MMSNKKVLGKFEDELKSKIITGFIALKPKMYSFECIDNILSIKNKNEKYCIINDCKKIGFV